MLRLGHANPADISIHSFSTVHVTGYAGPRSATTPFGNAQGYVRNHVRATAHDHARLEARTRRPSLVTTRRI